MTNLAIRTEALMKVYKGDLGQKPLIGLEGLDLEVGEGEVFAFLGPNGAGKTTTIKLLTRLLYPTRGKIQLLGISNESRLSMEKVGYLPEMPNLYGYLTGLEFLDFVGRIFGLDPVTRRSRTVELTRLVGLEEKSKQAIRSYSRGMVQRLGMAQTLINDPSLLILDEPMSNLDPIGRKDFRDLILQLKDQGKTIFFSSHILSDAEMVADRVGILNKGKLVSVGKLGDWISSQAKSVEVIFEIDPEKLPRLNLPSKVLVVQDRQAMVRLEKEDQISDLIQKIEKWGGRLVSVVPQKKSLEDIFLEEIRR